MDRGEIKEEMRLKENWWDVLKGDATICDQRRWDEIWCEGMRWEQTWWDEMKWGMMRGDVMRSDVMWCDGRRCDAMRGVFMRGVLKGCRYDILSFTLTENTPTKHTAFHETLSHSVNRIHYIHSTNHNKYNTQLYSSWLTRTLIDSISQFSHPYTLKYPCPMSQLTSQSPRIDPPPLGQKFPVSTTACSWYQAAQESRTPGHNTEKEVKIAQDR